MKAPPLWKVRAIARRASVPRSRRPDLGLVFAVLLVMALTGYVILAPADSRSAIDAERVVPGQADGSRDMPLQTIRVRETLAPDTNLGAWCGRLPHQMPRTTLFCMRVAQGYSRLSRYLPETVESRAAGAP